MKPTDITPGGGRIRASELSDDLKEAERLFEWALSYERKGLKIAADALRDEGRKAFDRYLIRGQGA